MLEGVAIHPLASFVLGFEKGVPSNDLDRDIEFKEIHVHQRLRDNPLPEHVFRRDPKPAFIVVDRPLA